MSGLFGGGKNTSNTDEMLSNIKIQTSAWGMPIAVIYGTARVPANIIYYADFTAIPHTTTQQTGKGGGGSTQTSTSYTYTAAVMLAFGEGLVQLTGKVWVDKQVYDNPGALGFTVAGGNIAQSPWSYLVSKHPTQAVGYGSTAWAAHPALDLGSSGTTKNHSFEVTGLYAGANAEGDANPADIVLNMLTDPVHGGGWAASAVASLINFRTYCAAAALLLSPVFSEQKPLAGHLGDILQATNSAAVWNSGQLKIIPYGDQPVGAWTPNSTPLYALGMDDFLVSGSGDDPIKVTRKTAADAFNLVQVEFNNRFNDYASEVAEASDLANAELFGSRPASPIKASSICSPSVARNLAQIALQRALYIRNEFEFRLGWRYALLEPMDLVTLTDPQLGLNNTTVRITEIEEDENGEIIARAEEWPFGVATAVAYPNPGGDSNGLNMAVAPGNCNAPVIFEPPGDLTNGLPQVWIGTSGGADWGGCEIWASRDAGTYSRVGRITAPARHGVLAAGLAALVGSNPDLTNTLAVNLLISGGTLLSASTPDADHWETLCYVDGELLAYRTATLTGANAYSLTYLRRGLYGMGGTTSHLSNSLFMRLDQAVAQVDIDRWNTGETIYLKFPSFNRYGLALQDISALSPIAYVVTGRVRVWPAPSNVTIAISITPPA